MEIMKLVIFDGTQSQKWFENKSGTNRIFIVSVVNKQPTPPNKKTTKQNKTIRKEMCGQRVRHEIGDREGGSCQVCFSTRG